MKQYIHLFTLSLLALHLVGCSGGNNVPQEKWLTLKKDIFSISYPESWAPDSTASGDVLFNIQSPRRDVGDKELESISLVTQDIGIKDWDLDSFVVYIENQLSLMIQDLKIIENERIEDETQPYHRILYKGRFAEKNITHEQRYWVVGDSAYTLAFSATSKDYDWFKEDAKKMMDSFSLN